MSAQENGAVRTHADPQEQFCNSKIIQEKVEQENQQWSDWPD